MERRAPKNPENFWKHFLEEKETIFLFHQVSNFNLGFLLFFKSVSGVCCCLTQSIFIILIILWKAEINILTCFAFKKQHPVGSK